MTEVCATSSVSVNEVQFNWKINNFGVMFNVAGKHEISSPKFTIRNNKCWLRLSEQNLVERHYTESDDWDTLRVYENLNNMRSREYNTYYNFNIDVELAEKDMILGGFIIIETEDSKLSGIFGDPSGEIFQEHATAIHVKNETPSEEHGNYHFRIDPKHAKHVEIRAKLYVPSSITSTIIQAPANNTGLTKLSADMRTMFNKSSQYYDFSIKCEGKTFPCHEFVLRARSTVMETMFDTEMEEANMRSMTIKDVGPSTMTAALEYMYTGEITVEVDNIKELIYFADKYNLEGLLEFCFRKLPQAEDHMVVDFLFMADKHNLVEYKKEAMVRINMNKSKYMEDEDFLKKLKEVPHLALELYKL